MNKVIFMGRLTANPELRYTTGSNIPVCRFNLAVDRPYQKSGEDRQADFFRIVAWRNTAEFISRYFRKGMRVLIEGYLRNNDYDDNQGVRHYSVEVHVEKAFFADSRRDDSPGGGFSQQPSYGMPTPQDVPAPQNDPGDGFFPLSDDDDDLPF